jgi:hypothetical protein
MRWAAYPDHLAAHEGNDLDLEGRHPMPTPTGAPTRPSSGCREPDIKDQFAFRYPLGPNVTPPAVNEDPGRIRFEVLHQDVWRLPQG